MKLKTDSVLTKSQTRVAMGFVEGKIGKEVADDCGISYNTMVRHVQNIYDKTGIPRSTNALVAWFLAQNFNLDLGELRRGIGAIALLCLFGFQMVASDFDTQYLRRVHTRRAVARRVVSKRPKREERTYYFM